MSGTVYAALADLNNPEDRDNVISMANEGTPVIIAEDLEDVADMLNIDKSDIQIV